ncbi:ankyrin repeat domain-containing protein, partial [Salmonella sp. s51228]|uniref:ankyrin repeat domain-containing protein n=1 Tax=Salmonella sp. s51228 TaxID=3159652 RepID=UPI00397EDCD7
PSKISSEMLKVWDIMGQRAVEIAIKNKNITMLYHFINKGANLDTIEAKMLYTDLHQAALTDDINVTRLVLNNIDIKNIDLAGADDLTALHRAVINSNNEITELLLSYGADPKLTVNGSSILGLVPLSEAGDEIVNIIRKYCSDDVYANLEEYRFSNDDDGYDDDDDEDDKKEIDDDDDDADGEWEPPMIDNPEYKGEWEPKKIDNPDYKGVWEHPEIDNPDFEPDDSLYEY